MYLGHCTACGGRTPAPHPCVAVMDRSVPRRRLSLHGWHPWAAERAPRSAKPAPLPLAPAAEPTGPVVCLDITTGRRRAGGDDGAGGAGGRAQLRAPDRPPAHRGQRDGAGVLLRAAAGRCGPSRRQLAGPAAAGAPLCMRRPGPARGMRAAARPARRERSSRDAASSSKCGRCSQSCQRLSVAPCALSSRSRA